MAFWKKFYKSKYTGAEIDAAIAKAGDATKVTANPVLAGTEAALTGLEVGTTKYKVEQPINVVANPTLAGTEPPLTGLQVGNTKYKIDFQTNYIALDDTAVASLLSALTTALPTVIASGSADIDLDIVDEALVTDINEILVNYEPTRFLTGVGESVLLTSAVSASSSNAATVAGTSMWYVTSASVYTHTDYILHIVDSTTVHLHATITKR